jgi:hypothetical protein
MANLFLFANNAASSLAAPISNSATALTVQSGAGAEFPSPGASQQFSATLTDAATGLLNEVTYCTARTGDTFTTIVRGQEGTVALNWVAGDLVANLLTAGQMNAMVQQVAVSPGRIVTASGSFPTTTADANGFIGLLRTSGVAASSTTLPSNAQPNQTYTYQDLAGNFGQFNLTVNAPAGMTIAGRPAATGNINRQSLAFTFYGSNVWGVAGLVG